MFFRPDFSFTKTTKMSILSGNYRPHEREPRSPLAAEPAAFSFGHGDRAGYAFESRARFSAAGSVCFGQSSSICCCRNWNKLRSPSQLDLAKLRIEKWKTDANTKRGSQGDADSIERNLQTALPEIIGRLRNSPENLTVTFKLYRNLDALYDVFGSVAESAGAFGGKDEYQSLQNDLMRWRGRAAPR